MSWKETAIDEKRRVDSAIDNASTFIARNELDTVALRYLPELLKYMKGCSKTLGLIIAAMDRDG
jgi:hypothetical protein